MAHKTIAARVEQIAEETSHDKLKDLYIDTRTLTVASAKNLQRSVILCYVTIAIIESLRIAAGSELTIGPLKITDSSFAKDYIPAVAMLLWAHMIITIAMHRIHLELHSQLFKHVHSEAYNENIELILFPATWIRYSVAMDNYGKKFNQL